MAQLFHFISNLVSYDEPLKSFILSGLYAIILMMFIIIIGYIVNIIEIYQIKFISKFFGIKIANIMCNRLTFPGIVVHELSHAVFASIFGARVDKIKLISLRNDGRLGWVEYTTRGRKISQGLQLSWSACAPTLVGIILEFILWKIFILGHSIMISILLIYLMISIGDHMSMSRQDIINYIRGSWAMFLLLYLMILAIRLI